MVRTLEEKVERKNSELRGIYNLYYEHLLNYQIAKNYQKIANINIKITKLNQENKTQHRRAARCTLHETMSNEKINNKI